MEEAAVEETDAVPGSQRNSKTDENIPIYALDPFYGPRLSRIDAIFFQMKLDDNKEGCREQVNSFWTHFNLSWLMDF